MNQFKNYIALIILVAGSANVWGQANINRMEYFIDTDPGIGNATTVPVTVGASITESLIIPTASLPVGFHTIYFRIQDENNEWSISESRSFYVSQSNLTTQADVLAMEYYFDTDPGIGAGTAIPLTAGTDIVESVTLSTSTLSSGHHTVYIRAQDSDGIWGESESRSFFIDALGLGRITGIEYFFNNDPGISNATQLPITPPVAQIDSLVNLSTDTLSVGTHDLGLRLIGENGFFSITEFASITLCDGAVADIVADTVCVGSPTTLLDLSSNVQVGDIYSWDFDIDGLEDDNTAGDKTFVYAAPGTYQAAVSIDRSGCVRTDTIPVIVTDIPLAVAGTDQAVCTTSASLAALPLLADEAGIWSISSGTGTFDDPSSPSATVSNVTSASVELVWSLTNTLGGCTSTDTVLITTNQPITALRTTETVDIGQTVVTNVHSTALINTGDVLTTTIVNSPLAGMATVQADGQVSYTPDPDAPIADSLQFRLTNQCSNFSENYLFYSVGNAPPIVDNSGSTIVFTGTQASLDLTLIISDPNNNLDFTTIQIISPPISGATARIDTDGVLLLDYGGITFSGTDQLEIQVCDLAGVCTNQLITIPDVMVGGEDPPLRVYNGVSPDGDGYNDFLEIENIEFYPDNRVIIINRWGAKVEEFKGYDNQSVVFKDSALPSGTYFYHIITSEGAEPVTGYFLLKND